MLEIKKMTRSTDDRRKFFIYWNNGQKTSFHVFGQLNNNEVKAMYKRVSIRAYKRIKNELGNCPRCDGTGKMPFAVESGICFKCGGSGYFGKLPMELNNILNQIDKVYNNF